MLGKTQDNTFFSLPQSSRKRSISTLHSITMDIEVSSDTFLYSHSFFFRSKQNLYNFRAVSPSQAVPFGAGVEGQDYFLGDDVIFYFFTSITMMPFCIPPPLSHCRICILWESRNMQLIWVDWFFQSIANKNNKGGGVYVYVYIICLLSRTFIIHRDLSMNHILKSAPLVPGTHSTSILPPQDKRRW